MVARRAALAVALVSACTTTTHRPPPADAVRPALLRVPGWTFATSHGDDVFPRDLVPRHDAPCAQVPLKPGWVARENGLPGLRDWRPLLNEPGHSVELYLDDPSLACGSTMGVRLGGDGGTAVQVRVVRIGWYHGAGARTVWTSPPMAVARAVEPQVHDHTVPRCEWRTEVSTRVGPGWTPGLYLAEALQQGRPVSAAGFVVRNDTAGSPLVAVHSNLTWQAYDDAGGASLYRGPAKRHADWSDRFAARAYVVSMLRPTTGAGLGHLLASDLPLAQLAEEHGFAMDHVMDTDLTIRPSVLLGRAGIVLPGHSEYWTRRAYEAVRVERDRGVNLLDLGANTMYWQARVLSDASGRPLEMRVYREAALDPETGADPALTTVRWAGKILRRSPSALLGEGFAAAGVTGGLVLHDPPAWLAAQTSIHDGLVLPDAMLNEADGSDPQDPAAPPNVQVLAEGVLRGHPTLVVSSSYYSDPSGAAIFDAGTTRWLCIALDTCPEGVVPLVTSTAVRQLTVRLLWAFSRPRWGAAHPSHHDVPASATALRATLPAEVLGSYRH